MEREDIEEGPGVVECDGLESSNRSFFWQVNQPTKKRAGDDVGLIAEVQNKCYRPNLNGGKLTSVPTTRFGSTNGAAIILFYFILFYNQN